MTNSEPKRHGVLHTDSDDQTLTMISASLHFSNILDASRDLFGRGYFSLGVAEQRIVEEVIWKATTSIASGIAAPAGIEAAERQPAGFVPPKSA
jgi:hypothetical protein